MNSGEKWSKLDLIDLRNSLRLGQTIEEIARFLCRDVEEVQAKIAELQSARRG